MKQNAIPDSFKIDFQVIKKHDGKTEKKYTKTGGRNVRSDPGPPPGPPPGTSSRDHPRDPPPGRTGEGQGRGFPVDYDIIFYGQILSIDNDSSRNRKRRRFDLTFEIENETPVTRRQVGGFRGR